MDEVPGGWGAVRAWMGVVLFGKRALGEVKCQHVIGLVFGEASRESHGSVWAEKYVCPATLQWGACNGLSETEGGRESVVEDCGWLEGCGGGGIKGKKKKREKKKRKKDERGEKEVCCL